MTKEEAKLLLIRPTVSSNVISETKAREIEAYIMAIEALSADAVMRDATAEERSSVQKYIDSISTEVVQGEWIRVGHDIYECSLCHQNVMTKDIDCYAYCHRCGAKMHKGGDTE